MKHYYNEFDPRNVAMLKQLMADGLIPDGDIDGRSIKDVKASELRGYTSCHFFAGIGGWSLALRLAGWPDERPVWTGSCPCQPFSTAGKHRGGSDERHLWPTWFQLIKECKPSVVFGEQVASAIPHGWLDGVYADMEAEDYQVGSCVLPACSVNAPHRRDRLWFVANAEGEQDWRLLKRHTQSDVAAGSGMADSPSDGLQIRGWGEVHEPRSLQESQRCGEDASQGVAQGDTLMQRCEGHRGFEQESVSQGWQGEERYTTEAGFWDEHDWVICGDGKARRTPTAKSGIRLLGNGLPARVATLHGFGNAIVPQNAAKFIQASM